MNDLYERAYLQGKYNQITDLALNKPKYSKRYFQSKMVVIMRKVFGNHFPKKYIFDSYKGQGYIDALRNI
jgi:hypothetical protein